MALVNNHSGLSCCVFSKAGRERERFDVIVLRGTFDFARDDAEIDFAQEQAPIVDSDEHAGPVKTNPLAAVLAREGDLVLHKPSTDVHVIGSARSRDDRYVSDWLASVTVGPVTKIVRLIGPRFFERHRGGFTLTSAQPAQAIALDYRHAFGGALRVPGSLFPDQQDVYLLKDDNPAGGGWLPDEGALRSVAREARPYFEAHIEAAERMPAPQMEHPDDPIKSPFQRSAAQGLGPIARWWSPRTQYTGTLDARWLATKYPALPDDFDPRFYQSAHPDLICPSYLRGDERIVLDGLLPEGRVSMRLPGVVPLCGVTRASGAPDGGRLSLDTVIVDLDQRRVSLLWRGAFHRRDPARRIAVELFTL